MRRDVLTLVDRRRYVHLSTRLRLPIQPVWVVLVELRRFLGIVPAQGSRWMVVEQDLDYVLEVAVVLKKVFRTLGGFLGSFPRLVPPSQHREDSQ